jgi:hypothetical protein
MIQQHPITPPPELVKQWIMEATEPSYVPTQAARWGADQELEACIQWIKSHFDGMRGWCDDLRAARRPQPPSLKAQALQAAQRFYANGHEDCNDEEVTDDFDIIRRALESLPD